MKTNTWLAAGLVVAGIAGFAPQAHAACTFGDSSEASLQQSFNELFMSGSALDAVNDCLEDGVGAGRDGVWQSQGSSAATILLEIAGFANFNEFGLYDPSNPTNHLGVFSGPQGPGTSASLTFENIVGGTQVTMQIVGSPAPSVTAVFSSEVFGFFLSTPEGNTFFSESSLNLGGVDRSYAYRGSGQWFQTGAAQGTQFGAGDAILAYEDLLNGDNDFQDFVVLVRGVEPVPLPAAGWLLLSGLLGLRACRVRRN